ncbi:MAG: hypothetical protein BWY06_01868 [Candidatus Latescibacteria bacterium ADurb.Bin168]|nr:MAG: hypothetical protein BWY06_01868 [Candidatus Latescibacteria bacterium ADurb.Bin168]
MPRSRAGIFAGEPPGRLGKPCAVAAFELVLPREPHHSGAVFHRHVIDVPPAQLGGGIRHQAKTQPEGGADVFSKVDAFLCPCRVHPGDTKHLRPCLPGVCGDFHYSVICVGFEVVFVPEGENGVDGTRKIDPGGKRGVRVGGVRFAGAVSPGSGGAVVGLGGGPPGIAVSPVLRADVHRICEGECDQWDRISRRDHVRTETDRFQCIYDVDAIAVLCRFDHGDRIGPCCHDRICDGFDEGAGAGDGGAGAAIDLVPGEVAFRVG